MGLPPARRAGLRIEMVWKVRHQHRIQIGQGMPRVGKVPRIDENPGAIGLGENRPHAPGG